MSFCFVDPELRNMGKWPLSYLSHTFCMVRLFLSWHVPRTLFWDLEYQVMCMYYGAMLLYCVDNAMMGTGSSCFLMNLTMD